MQAQLARGVAPARAAEIAKAVEVDGLLPDLAAGTAVQLLARLLRALDEYDGAGVERLVEHGS